LCQRFDTTSWEFNRYLVKNNYSHIIRFQLSREQERMRTGVRIGQLYEGKKMDTKTLTTRSGIDVVNQYCIEQGRYSAGFDILAKVATTLDCKIDFVTNK